MPSPKLRLLVLLLLLPESAVAIGTCGSAFRDARDFEEKARAEAIARAPVKYRDMANDIRLVVRDDETRLIPFATEQQGTMVVVLPMAFVRLACQLSLATYLKIDSVLPERFEQASRAAASCVDGGAPLRTCLIALGDDLDARYRVAFGRQSARSQQVATGIYYAALWQIQQHEYAHHYLRHFARMGAKQVARIDAEFESDLYAITNGVQAGDPETAMYYVFHPLAHVEAGTKRLSTPDYESSSCRAGNINSITSFLGIVPLVVLDAAGGGGMRVEVNSPALLRQAVASHFRSTPDLTESCGRLAKSDLDKTREELRRLAFRLTTDAELLFSTDAKVDEPRAARLVSDLSDMTRNFEFANGIASKSIAYMLIGWGLKGRARTPLMGQVDRLLQNRQVVDNMQSEDLGRLLSAQALAVLQERIDLPAKTRIDWSFRRLQNAVAYNAGLTEAWENLAFISFMRGDCATAAQSSSKAVMTHNRDDKEAYDAAVYFAQTMANWATNPAACKEAAAKFHPYDGL